MVLVLVHCKLCLLFRSCCLIYQIQPHQASASMSFSYSLLPLPQVIAHLASPHLISPVLPLASFLFFPCFHFQLLPSFSFSIQFLFSIWMIPFNVFNLNSSVIRVSVDTDTPSIFHVLLGEVYCSGSPPKSGQFIALCT